MRNITEIIIHCSDSLHGNVALIDKWHKARGWKGCGYHYVILNGSPFNPKTYENIFDGKFEEGRKVEEVGSHCVGHNQRSIGICLIGKDQFTDMQFDTLRSLIKDLWQRFGKISVIGHCETDTGKKQGKSCPNFDVRKFLLTLN